MSLRLSWKWHFSPKGPFKSCFNVGISSSNLNRNLYSPDYICFLNPLNPQAHGLTCVAKKLLVKPLKTILSWSPTINNVLVVFRINFITFLQHKCYGPYFDCLWTLLNIFIRCFCLYLTLADDPPINASNPPSILRAKPCIHVDLTQQRRWSPGRLTANRWSLPPLGVVAASGYYTYSPWTRGYNTSLYKNQDKHLYSILHIPFPFFIFPLFVFFFFSKPFKYKT